VLGNKKNDQPLLGVPLDDLEVALKATSLNTIRDGNSLVVRHPNFSTHVDAIRPANRETEDGLINEVLVVRTALPREFAAKFSKPEMSTAMNTMATLGALTADGEGIFVGSRLTMYEGEQAWKIQFGLLLFSVIGSTDSLLGAMSRMFSGQDGKKSASAWVERDFEQVSAYLSNVSVCTTGGLGLTAEFGLREGAISAAFGDHYTALWRLQGDQPHPEIGGGLFCLLQMPHQIPDEARLDRILVQLNQMEMAPHDLPPHFGAWCRGQIGNNPAYVSFLPNALHSAAGIAVNMSIWAFHRANWASAMLASMGNRA
jgi:hypothetical protein